jgi:copper chaperone
MSDTVELAITGMTCNHCVARTAKALEAVPGVDSVEVALEPGGAVITGRADAGVLIDAVKGAGYSAAVKS